MKLLLIFLISITFVSLVLTQSNGTGTGTGSTGGPGPNNTMTSGPGPNNTMTGGPNNTMTGGPNNTMTGGPGPNNTMTGGPGPNNTMTGGNNTMTGQPTGTGGVGPGPQPGPQPSGVNGSFSCANNIKICDCVNHPPCGWCEVQGAQGCRNGSATGQTDCAALSGTWMTKGSCPTAPPPLNSGNGNGTNPCNFQTPCACTAASGCGWCSGQSSPDGTSTKPWAKCVSLTMASANPTNQTGPNFCHAYNGSYYQGNQSSCSPPPMGQANHATCSGKCASGVNVNETAASVIQQAVQQVVAKNLNIDAGLVQCILTFQNNSDGTTGFNVSIYVNHTVVPAGTFDSGINNVTFSAVQDAFTSQGLSSTTVSSLIADDSSVTSTSSGSGSGSGSKSSTSYGEKIIFSLLVAIFVILI